MDLFSCWDLEISDLVVVCKMHYQLNFAAAQGSRAGFDWEAGRRAWMPKYPATAGVAVRAPCSQMLLRPSVHLPFKQEKKTRIVDECREEKYFETSDRKDAIPLKHGTRRRT